MSIIALILDFDGLIVGTELPDYEILAARVPANRGPERRMSSIILTPPTNPLKVDHAGKNSPRLQ
jgi:hypothetical protein